MEKYKLWEVTAEARNKQTGKLSGPRRSEIISTENKLFSFCGTAAQVISAYEEFWNRPGSVEQVKVISVWPATQAQDDAPRPNSVARKGARPNAPAPPPVTEKQAKPSRQRRLEKRAAARTAVPVASGDLSMVA